MKIRIKPKEIKAIQWTDNCSEMKHFCGNYCTITYEYAPGLDDFWMLTVDTIHDTVNVALNDWVVKLDKNTFIVVKNFDFKNFFDIIE